MAQATVQPQGVSPKLSADDIPFNPHMKQQRTVSDWIVDIMIGVLTALILFVVIYPIWFIVMASFSDPAAVAKGQVTLLPVGFNLEGYAMVFANEGVWTGYRNTFIYSFLGTALNVAVTIPAAFALSRREFKPRRVLLFLFTFTMFFAGGIIPNYLLYKDLNLLDSMWVFILPSAVNVFNLIIARSFFETSIPEELHEASELDGLNYYGYFFRIVIPLSGAIIAVITLYYFVQHWNDFFTGLVYLRDWDKQPLQNWLQRILLGTQAAANSSGSMNLGQMQLFADQIKYGIILISTIPLLILYPFIQKYFNKGVMIGAVKG
ncbi:carbohydrate ABC transporter permease [Bifidobacterium eulemuris]|uniref:Carbohydrate ABC transporter permease n=1 Tax=Bifidobacterium eulemuris TaxID=1765219 RepID=A0A261G9P9_9BIFI|nr:carbohydrate ABC transporter permease [Bifidobacterium eulemuris]OZG68134.1 sugar ABC transporter permease [Bifidobacterium eulemuris]QOL31803.1 carbohydrate ABC transporter permease [Bifidobacterium eulemuris]